MNICSGTTVLVAPNWRPVIMMLWRRWCHLTRFVKERWWLAIDSIRVYRNKARHLYALTSSSCGCGLLNGFFTVSPILSWCGWRERRPPPWNTSYSFLCYSVVGFAVVIHTSFRCFMQFVLKLPLYEVR